MLRLAVIALAASQQASAYTIFTANARSSLQRACLSHARRPPSRLLSGPLPAASEAPTANEAPLAGTVRGIQRPFSHGEVYNPKGCNCHPKEPAPGCPAVLVAPPHYIQGPDVINSVGRYVRMLLKCDKVGLLNTVGGHKRKGSALYDAFREQGVGMAVAVFGGVNSYEEVDRIVEFLTGRDVQAIVAVGGGSIADCGKLVAYKMGLPTVTVPTLAATDAPCSALSIMYTPEGGYNGGVVYPLSPSIVVVDTAIVAKAGKRSLVSGYGDALSTWYEARTVYENPRGLSMLEARPTATAVAIGELCAKLLYANGQAAIAAVEAGVTNEALEKVVEANTLLSGMGFESGGLAASHAVAQALSLVPSVHDKHMHGEMVAVGLMTMLIMERDMGLVGREEDLAQVGQLFCAVGLPVNHEQAHFDPSDQASIDTFLSVALEQWFCHNEPFPVTKQLIWDAFTEANRYGDALIMQHGDAAYRTIHGE